MTEVAEVVGGLPTEHEYRVLHERVWALETAIVRHLSAHAAGQPGSCGCGTCLFLRSLFDDGLAERLRFEEGRMAEEAARVVADWEQATRAQIEAAERDAVELQREIVARQGEIARLRARKSALVQALDAYGRVMEKAGQPHQRALPAGSRLGGSSMQAAVRALAEEWAAAHGGEVLLRAVKEEGMKRGIFADKKQGENVLNRVMRDGGYEKVRYGLYRVAVREREPAA